MILLQLLLVAPSLGAGVLNKPQMGWDSWNTYKFDVSESLVQDTAAAMVKNGLADAGYKYVIIDDGWQTWTRGSDGRQRANATKFPTGIPALANYVHDRGLKFGIYSDAGIYDCGFYPGSYGYEELDADQYASWGVDYLKYDNCGGFQANTLSVQERFWRMSYALKNSGRTIFYSLCEWGHQFPWFWADQFSESYRMSGDIHSSFSSDNGGVCKTAYCLDTGYAGVSVLTMINKMRELSRFQKLGSYADMDMLEIGTGTMNNLEEQTHFSFWAALKSPLIIGADVTNISDSSLAVLSNRDIIAISQDDAGVAVNYIPDLSTEGEFQVWGGPLSSGSSRYVILALNYGSEAADITINFDAFPDLQVSRKSRLQARDVWDQKNLGTVTNPLVLRNVNVAQTKVLVLSTR